MVGARTSGKNYHFTEYNQGRVTNFFPERSLKTRAFCMSYIPSPTFYIFVTVTQSCLQVVILLPQLPKEIGFSKGKTEGIELVTVKRLGFLTALQGSVSVCACYLCIS